MFDKAKFVSFLIEYNELLERFYESWNKISEIIKNDLIVNQQTMKNI